MDAAVQFAGFAARTRYEDLPIEVVDVVKTTFLDSLGVCTAGSSGPGVKEVVDMVAGWGGHKESTVIGYGHRLPAVGAALANGAMIRVLDYNETYDSGRSHPSISVIPAAMAVAEKVRKVKGKDLIAAIAAAFDIECRMSSVISTGHWLGGQVTGYISAATVAGKLLNLTEEQLINAFGIAYSQVAGGRQSTTERAITRGLQGAFAADGGILSALLAQRGITGPRDSLEGEHGYFNAYYNGKYDRKALVDGLGKKFDFINISFKPYPSCRQLHCHILATLELVEAYDIRPEDVDEVTAYVGDFVKATFEPLDAARDPLTVTECQFSGPYVIATAIARRNIGLADFVGPGFRDPRVLELAQKVVCKDDPTLSQKMEAARLEIKTKGGRRLASRRVDFAKGHVDNPMTRDELVAKFKDCLTYAVRPIPEENADRVVDMVEHLEEVKDVGQIVKLLAGGEG